MKKAIAILMVLLVAGVMFADDVPGNATLTLTSSVTGQTVHGFYGGVDVDALTGTGIINYNTGNYPNYSEGVVMVSDNSQPVGFYSFYTNSAIGVSVDITAKPLASSAEFGEVGSESSVDVYVPYEITFSPLVSGGSTANIVSGYTEKSLGWSSQDGPIPAPNTIGFADAEKTLIEVSEVGGVKWATYSLGVKFNGSENISYGLPAGAYAGTVVAKITVN